MFDVVKKRIMFKIWKYDIQSWRWNRYVKINKCLNVKLLKFNMLYIGAQFTTNKYYYTHNNTLLKKHTHNILTYNLILHNTIKY